MTAQSKIGEIKDYGANTLARIAGCGTPSSRTSEGAQFLTRVRDALVDAAEFAADDFDPDNFDAYEIADDAPSVYTWTRWQQFTDLQAWQEDPSELAGDNSDMEALAGICLYIIAERLVNGLLDEIRQAAEEDDDDE